MLAYMALLKRILTTEVEYFVSLLHDVVMDLLYILSTINAQAQNCPRRGALKIASAWSTYII